MLIACEALAFVVAVVVVVPMSLLSAANSGFPSFVVGVDHDGRFGGAA